MAEERKLAEDDKKLLEEKLGRSDEHQTHTMNNTNTSFMEEKEETDGRAKNSKWTVSYGFRRYEEKRKGRNEEEEEEVKKGKVKFF